MPDSSGNASALEAAIQAAARILVAGGVIVYPTETLYGLGVDALNPTALERLVRLKGRESGKPIAVLISDTFMLRQLVEEVPPAAQALMRRFWPGPLTVVLRARAAVPRVLVSETGGIGVRISSHPVATTVVRTVGRPITAPSANPAGQPGPTEVAQARAYFGEHVDFYLDGGHVPGEPASTVVEVGDTLRVIRAGAICSEALEACLREAA